MDTAIVALVLLLIVGSISGQKQQQQAGDTNLTCENYSNLHIRSICYILGLSTYNNILCNIAINIEEISSCVSREEFESLQKELNYWQNTTITILKKYLTDNEGGNSA